jgi:hypothetical protein
VRGNFEFCFVSVVSSHADNQGENAAADSDLNKLNGLGKEGWQISGICPDPQHPAARLMISLQRDTAV